MRSRLGPLAAWVLLGAALAFPLVFTLPYPRDVMIRIFLYAMLATAWNLLAGYCGQISLGHAVFFGTGAYTSTVLLHELVNARQAHSFSGDRVHVRASMVELEDVLQVGRRQFVRLR